MLKYDSVDEIVGKYQKSVAGFVRQRVGDEGVVEELTQDILWAAYRAMPSFSGRSSEFSFICGIAKHKINDYFRKKKLKTILFSVSPKFEEMAAEALNPERDVLKEELKKEIKKTLSELSEDYQKIIRLKYIEELRSSQIAQKLKISLKAAESRLIRAKKKFQILWDYDRKENKKIVQARGADRG